MKMASNKLFDLDASVQVKKNAFLFQVRAFYPLLS